MGLSSQAKEQLPFVFKPPHEDLLAVDANDDKPDGSSGPDAGRRVGHARNGAELAPRATGSNVELGRLDRPDLGGRRRCPDRDPWELGNPSRRDRLEVDQSAGLFPNSKRNEGALASIEPRQRNPGAQPFSTSSTMV